MGLSSYVVVVRAPP